MKKNALLIFLVSLSLSVFAGDKTGNGGGGHVCPDSVELYDFYEGRHPDLHNLKVWEPMDGLTYEMYLKSGFERLEESFPGIVPGVQSLLNNIISIPYEKLVKPIKIPRIPDADIPFVHEDCDYQQIANWNDRFDSLFFSKRLYESLDSMSQAGLLFHEVFYKAGRDLNNLQHSNQVRKLVAKLFSDEKLEQSDVQNVFGDKVLLASKSGLCSVKFIYKAHPQRECVLTGKPSVLKLNERTMTSANNEFQVDCNEIHTAGSMTLKYTATARSLCEVTAEINGHIYQMNDNEYEQVSILSFLNFM